MLRVPATMSLLLLAACGGDEKKVQPALPPEAYDEPVQDIDAGPDNAGEVPMAEVEAHMDGVKQAFRDCAATTTYEGKVTFQVTVAPEGTATAEMLTGTGDADIDACIVAAFDGVEFPKSERGQRFKYGFTFK